MKTISPADVPNTRKIQIVAVLLLMLLVPSSVLTQTTTTGSLRINVLDSSRAAVAGADVTITNVTTGQVRTQKTADDGSVTFQNLQPGKYRVTVTASGFSTASEEVSIEIGRAITKDMQLAVGAMVTVPVVATVTVEPGDPLSNEPNLNNDLSPILRVLPGAVAGSATALGRIVVDGKGKEQQTFYLDRLDVTPLIEPPTGDPALGVLESLLKPNVALNSTPTELHAGPITVRPTKFDDTATYYLSPAYGPGTGVLVEGVSYLGEKNWNFSFFEAFRNDALNARNFFDYEGKNGLRRNQYGVKLAVPTKKNVFLFFGYDGINGRLERLIYEAVPVDAECNCAQGPLAPFMNAFLPEGTTTVNDVSQSDGFVAARRRARSTSEANSFNARLDVNGFKFGSANVDALTFRVTRQTGEFFVPDGVTARQQRQTLVLANGVATMRMVQTHGNHEVRFGFNQNRAALDVRFPFSGVREISQALVTFSSSSIPVKNLPGQLVDIPTTIPTASIGGLSKGIGRGSNQNPVSFNMSYHFDTILGGSNTFNAGVEARFVNFGFDKWGGLTYTFSDLSSLRAGNVSSVNFLSDLSGVAPLSFGTGPRHIRQQNYLSYVQFTPQFFREFFVSFGLRYDYFGPPRERDNRAVIIDPVTGKTVPLTESFFKTEKFNFQPRIGISYTGWSRYALRAGAGIYTGSPRIGDLLLPIESDRFNSGIEKVSFPFAASNIISNFISHPETRQFQPLSFARDFKTPERIYRWDLMLTRTFGESFDLNLLYSGSEGRQLPVAGVANQIISVHTNEDPTKSATVVRQFDTVENGEVSKPLGELLFRSSVGRSSLNSLTIQLRRNRLIKEFDWEWLNRLNFRTFNMQYTLARNVGNVTGTAASTTTGFDSDYGPNTSDARHTFSFSASSRLWSDDRPRSGWWGWTIGPTISARSGLPIIIRLDRPDVVYVDSGGNVFGDAAVGRTAKINTPGGGASGGARVPDLVHNAQPYSRNGLLFLDPAAFAIPQPGTFGNLKRGLLRGPASFQVDLSVTRTLFLKALREENSILGELKVEIFNIFNRANFGNPVGTLKSSLGTSATGERIQPGVSFTRAAAGAFGVITSADPGRTVQFTLTFKFNEAY